MKHRHADVKRRRAVGREVIGTAEPQVAGGLERRFHGLLGNGVAEISVTIRSWRDCVEVAFGAGRLFEFVEERLLRKLLGELVRERALS